jgi:ribose transport system ATP-binding protein
MSFALELSGICKAYGPNRVLTNVSCSIEPGVVVSIVGENGAGKSTLAKIIAGVAAPDAGAISLFGAPVSFSHPAEAMRAGVAMVHQEIALLDNLTVAENIGLGHEPLKAGFLDRASMDTTARTALTTLGSTITPSTLVGTLSLAQKQIVEIARALSLNAKVLILDEPTSSISDSDALQLLQTVKKLRDTGVTILYVSHRIAEVLEISDWVLALRDGELSGTLRKPNLTRESIVRSMIGRDLREMYPYRPRPTGAPVLELVRFQASSEHAPLDLTLRAGEIVGIAGLIGSGRTELLEALYGIRAPYGGTVRINGSVVAPGGTTAALRAGVALVPESRKEQALIESFSIADTVALSHAAEGCVLSRRSPPQERMDAEHWISELSIHCTGANQAVQALSGGNQQKVFLGRCLASQPRVVLLDEPTRGVDIGARHSIYELLFTLAERGLAVLFVSSELEEVLGLADRALVMNSGRVAGIIERRDLSEQAVMSLATHHDESRELAIR